MTAPQPDTETLVESVREAIRFDRDDHHARCDSRRGGECDCYNRFSAPYHEALDALAARLAEAEARVADLELEADGWHTHVARAEAAERRVATLEAALEEIRDRPHGELDEHDMRSVADAALDPAPSQPAQPLAPQGDERE